jgi:hypothetical protein
MLCVLLTSPGSAQVVRFDQDLTLGNQAVSEVRYYRGSGYRGGYRRYGYRYGYRRYGYRGYGYRGAAVAAGAAAVGAGAAGLAVGAIGGAVAGTPGYAYGGTQVTAEAEAYCRSQYSNYDPATRLGLGTNGIWYFCPSYGGGYATAQ